MKANWSKGFTLIELLIVIAILGILAAGILVAINPVAQMQKARNSQRKADLRNMQQAVESYAIRNNGVYPNDGWRWCGAAGSYYTAGCDTDNFIPFVVAAGDIKILPRDPSTGSNTPPCDSPNKSYLYLSNGTDYKILAHCTPEGNMANTDPFYDPVRPTWAWQVSSPGGIDW